MGVSLLKKVISTVAITVFFVSFSMALVVGSHVPESFSDWRFLRAHVFSDYVVYELMQTDMAGFEVKVVQTGPTTGLKIGFFSRPILVVEDGPNFFMGLWKDVLIIDTGTAPEPRLLSLYHIPEKRLVHRDSYFSPIEIDGERLLYYRDIGLRFYDSDIEKRLPEELRFLEENLVSMLKDQPYLGVAISEKVYLDLLIFELVNTGEYVIRYVQ